MDETTTAKKSGSLSTVDSKNGLEDKFLIRSLTPIQAGIVLKAVNHWRQQHERKINSKISDLHNKKRSKNATAENEVDQIVARKIPFDILTKDWFKKQNVSIDQRIYLLDNLIPTLVLGIEKLLTVSERKGLINSQQSSPDFNPINFLAQFLMRNNPKYSNFAESSPYARGIRKLLNDLKKEAYNQEENKLLKMKADAKQRKEERQKLEKLNLLMIKGRSEALQELFLQWVGESNGVIFLHLVQSALRSYRDIAGEQEKIQKSEVEPESTEDEMDMTGKMISLNEFVKMIGEYAKDFSETEFSDLIKHLSHLANEYKMSAQMESLRMILANLFIACDHGDTGLLDRKRVLKLLESFFDNTKDASIRSSLRNPRKWPVVDIDEQEEEDDPFQEALLEENQLQNESEQNHVDERISDISSANKDLNVKAETKLDEQADKSNHDSTSLDVEAEGKDSKTNVVSNSAVPEKSSALSENTTDDSRFASVDVTLEMALEIKDIIERVPTATDAGESPVKSSRAHSVATGSVFDPSTLNQAQFVIMLLKFLGDIPSRSSVEALVRYVRAGYIETEEERLARLEKARSEARSAKRRLLMDQLFDLWDVDGSGYLEMSEIEMVLSKWREEGLKKFKEASEVFEEAHGRINRKQFKRYIEKIVEMFPDEDCFDSLVAFLFASVERSFEERKRGEFRKKWLASIDTSSQTSGALLEPVFKTTFQALCKDAEIHGRNKKTSAYVAVLEPNDTARTNHAGDTFLRYVSCTPDDVSFILNKILYRDMKCVSFTVVDSGKPIHVPRVIHNGGVYLWNPSRKEEETEGSLVMLPLKDHERRVIGVLGIDTLPDPREKAVFVTHEISFYQGIAKALSSAIQFIDSRRKTIKIAESAVSWILRRSANVREVNIYLVEPGLKASDGLVLRKMLTLRQNNNDVRYEVPPRLERKDNLFRDYLFKCIDTSETLTADAYGERHTAFPLRDASGMVVAIVDISIGEQKQLPHHENKEILRMLKLLATAHKEVAREIAGEEKNIVLEVEKEHQEKRIDVLFDRIMLQDLRDNVGRLDARAFAEIKSYKDPPKIVHDIVKAVLEIYFGGKEDDEMLEKLEEWTNCKQLVNAELVNWISTFDPTASTNLALNGETLAKNLSNVPTGAVAKHGSLPAQYLFNWAFVCLSLIEHTSKMRETRPVKGFAFEAKSDSGEETSSMADAKPQNPQE